MIIAIHFDTDTHIARTVHENDETFIVQLLTKDGNGLYSFMDDMEIVRKESVLKYYDVCTLEETNLFVRVPIYGYWKT
jgi:hypothetical protein